MRGGVVAEFPDRRGPPGAALVEDHDPVMGRIEEAPVRRDRPRAGPAVEEDHRRPVGVAGDLPVEIVQGIDGESSAVMGLDRGIQLFTRHLRVPRLGRLREGFGRGPGPAPGALFYRRLAARPILVLAALILCWQAPVAAESDRRGVVSAVVDGDTVTLDSGVGVRLVGIQAPKLSLGRAGFRDWPLAAEARAGLEALVAGASVRLVYGGRRIDRHRRLLAHLEREAAPGRPALWVQGEMLRRGLARVYTFSRTRGANHLK